MDSDILEDRHIYKPPNAHYDFSKNFYVTD